MEMMKPVIHSDPEMKPPRTNHRMFRIRRMS